MNKKKINVLMIGNHPTDKGGMTSVINQIRRHDWAADGVELSFIPTYLPAKSIGKALYFGASFLRILGRMLLTRPDIVHMHMSYKGSFSRKYMVHKLCRFFHVKDIIHLHGSEFEVWYDGADQKTQKKVRRLLKESGGFIALGDKWEKVLKRIEPSAHVTVIPNGIAIPRRQVRWDESRVQLLFLGFFHKRKGVDNLIRALAKLKAEGGADKLCLAIGGTGDEEENLKKLVDENGLNEAVSFKGWVTGKEKKALLLKSQILVSPSYNEGLPISILEAASFGMPVVSTDVGDISSVIKDGRNGILIQPGDVDALAEGIRRVSEKDTFERMSQESARIIRESFSIDSFYAKLLKMYYEMVGADE